MISSKINGFGHYLPKKIMKNDDLPKTLETTDEWIESRTGIKQRHIAEGEETTSFMAAKAAEEALLNAEVSSLDIDLIICATTTPDHPFPSTAVKVQTLIGAKNAFAFDVQAVCSGFVYGLSIADSFILSKKAKTGLVIGADSMSRLLNWHDRNTAVLFGDGAGAFLLGATEEKNKGIRSTHLFSDGGYYDLLYVSTDEPFDNKRGYLKMEGRSVFKHAVKKIGESILLTLQKNNLTIDDIDWLIPHQANKRILEAIADQFSLPLEKMIISVDRHANTSAASIPLATYEGIKSGKIKKGDLVLLEALGAGLTWGAALVRL
jgi:3-oxoacyl-[acyl-carrier-protein] synthase-3